MSNSDYYSAYIRAKFEYLSLKFNINQSNHTNQSNQSTQSTQTGGYSYAGNNDGLNAINFAAAAIAVINCTYFGTGQQSVDCPAAIDPNVAKRADLEAQIAALDSSIKNRGKKMELTSQLNSLNVVKMDLTNLANVSNRSCDNVLATVASVYLSILFNMSTISTTDTFSSALNDLMNRKIANCTTTHRTPAKIKEIIKYYLNVINKINEYLERIGKPNGVSYVDIFTSAEYGKSDKKVIEKLREKGLAISPADEENFRMVNEFIGANLQHVVKIPVHAVLSKLRISSGPLESTLLAELRTEYPDVDTNRTIDVANWIVFGVYTYERSTNRTTISNPITVSNPITKSILGKKLN